MQRVQTIKNLTGLNICLDTLKVSKKVAGVEYAIRDIVLAARKVQEKGMKVDYLNIGDPVQFGFQPPASAEIEMDFKGKDIGYYKIFMPEFSGKGVFIQILDENNNVIKDGIVETKMSVGYFDFEQSGTYSIKLANLSEKQMVVELEFGDTNGREMVIPGIVTFAGGLMVVISLYFKLRDYRIAQPDENIS